MLHSYKISFSFLLLMLISKFALAQNPVQYMGRASQAFGGMQQSGKVDSLQRRDKNADSITIYYKYFNSNEIKKLDTSINDFFVHLIARHELHHGRTQNSLTIELTTVDQHLSKFEIVRNGAK